MPEPALAHGSIAAFARCRSFRIGGVQLPSVPAPPEAHRRRPCACGARQGALVVSSAAPTEQLGSQNLPWPAAASPPLPATPARCLSFRIGGPQLPGSPHCRKRSASGRVPAAPPWCQQRRRTVRVSSLVGSLPAVLGGKLMLPLPAYSSKCDEATARNLPTAGQ